MSCTNHVKIDGKEVHLNKIPTSGSVIPQSRVVTFCGNWTVLRSPKGDLYKVSK